MSNIEWELKYINIYIESIRKKLEKHKAKCIKKNVKMIRANYDALDKNTQGWIRLRQEGDKITMTYKNLTGKKGAGAVIEHEIVIDSVVEADNFLKAIQWKQSNYIETYKEIWKLGKCEISIDTWPGLTPFIEIECVSENHVNTMSKKLGLDIKSSISGSVDFVYNQVYGINVKTFRKIPVLKFDNSKKILSKYVKKNKSLLNKVFSEQSKNL